MIWKLMCLLGERSRDAAGEYEEAGDGGCEFEHFGVSKFCSNVEEGKANDGRLPSMDKSLC